MIRILKLSFYYYQYLNYFYENNDVNNLNYKEHQETLFKDRFGWSDSFKYSFEKNKNISVQEIIVNDYQLQKKWINENSKFFFNDKWQLEYLKKQIEFYKPNVIFVNNPSLNQSFYEMILSYKVRLITYDGICSHNENLINYSDIIISCLKSTCDFYSKFNKKVFYMPHGFDRRILNNLSSNEIKNDSIFIGNIRNINHSKRVDLLNKVLSKTNIKIWIGDEKKNSQNSNLNKILNIKNLFINFKRINHIINIKKLFKKNNGQVYGMKMYNLLNQNKIILNNHIDNSRDEAANIRLFEGTGVGSCLVTDFKKNIRNFFSEDEIVLFKNYEEAVEKINYLSKNPKVAEEIALRGMKKVQTKHLLEDRWNSLYEYLISQKEIS